MKNVSLWLVTCACSGALALSGPADAQEGPRGGNARGSGSVQKGSGEGGGSVQGRGNARGERGQSGVRGRGQTGGESQRGESQRGDLQRGERPSGGRTSGRAEGEANRGRSAQERGQREMPNRGRESAQELQERARQRSEEPQQNRERGDSARESMERQREGAREGLEQRLEQRREQMQRGDNQNEPNERRSFRNPGALDEAQRRGADAAGNADNAARNAENREMRGADRLRGYLNGERGQNRSGDNRDQRPDGQDQANRGNQDQHDRDQRDADRFNPDRRRELGDRERDARERGDRERGDRERGDRGDNAVADERQESREELRERADRLQANEFRRWENMDQVADRVRARARSNQYRGPRFDQNFWQQQLGDYRGRGYYHVRSNRNQDGRYWWNPTPWNRLAGWVSFRFNEPYYYSYGPGGDVYYRNGYVYVRGDRYATIPEYYQQAVRVVRTVDVSEEEAKSMEWQPLGVFALSADESNEPSLVIQLAVNQDGILSGTFYDEQTKESRPLIGKVDRNSQRAVWHFADAEGTGIVMETTFANLSKEETSVLVHFGPEETESWLLVRLPAPEEL